VLFCAVSQVFLADEKKKKTKKIEGRVKLGGILWGGELGYGRLA
jgi:hypothetical protein